MLILLFSVLTMVRVCKKACFCLACSCITLAACASANTFSVATTRGMLATGKREDHPEAC
jgi:hypothetical protein